MLILLKVKTKQQKTSPIIQNSYCKYNEQNTTQNTKYNYYCRTILLVLYKLYFICTLHLKKPLKVQFADAFSYLVLETEAK